MAWTRVARGAAPAAVGRAPPHPLRRVSAVGRPAKPARRGMARADSEEPGSAHGNLRCRLLVEGACWFQASQIVMEQLRSAVYAVEAVELMKMNYFDV